MQCVAMCCRARKIGVPCISSKEPCISAKLSKESYIPAEEPGIPSKEHYVSAKYSKESYIHAKEPYIFSKKPCISSKDPCISVFLHDSPIYQHTATQCKPLQHTATHCTTLHHTATHCTTLHLTAPHCTKVQHTATHCNTLQHTATHYLPGAGDTATHARNSHPVFSHKRQYFCKRVLYSRQKLKSTLYCCSWRRCGKRWRRRNRLERNSRKIWRENSDTNTRSKMTTVCFVLQWVAVGCSVLQCVAVCCAVLCAKSNTNTRLQWVAMGCNGLQHADDLAFIHFQKFQVALEKKIWRFLDFAGTKNQKLHDTN